VVKSGRPGVARSVQAVFWDGVRAGLGVAEAGDGAGVSKGTAHEWFARAGGVVANGAGAVSGRFLSVAEREEIALGVAAGRSLRQIAAGLGRAVSTVSREVARNGYRGRYRYRALAAQAQADFRARRPKTAKLAGNDRLREQVAARLAERWSPEQISIVLRKQFPDQPEMRVSHETIYQSLYVQGRGGCAGSWPRACGPGGRCASPAAARRSAAAGSRTWC